MHDMIRMRAVLMAIVLTSVCFPAPPAVAGFTIAKPKAKKKANPAHPRRNRNEHHQHADEAQPAASEPQAAMGIDPDLMQKTIVEANYSATLTRDEQAHTAVIQALDGKTGWSVNFSRCAEPNRCGVMEFYTLWRVPNEANVCMIWGSEITKDPTRTLGKPFCYTLPGRERQMHLKLTSRQPPYRGIEALAPAEAHDRMREMIGTWTRYLAMLPQAYTIASEKCPRAADRCP
jgi:hypothetical protein